MSESLAKTPSSFAVRSAHWAGTWLLAIAAWELVFRMHWVDPRLLPGPSVIASTTGRLMAQGDIFFHIGVTLLGVLLSCVLAIPLGLALGVLLQRSKFWAAVFRPYVMFPLSIPKSIFLPLFILAIGIGLGQRVAFGVFSIVFVVILCTTAALETVQTDFLLVGKSFGASTIQKVRYIYLPSMLPVLLETLRLSVIFGFTAIILAEMYASKNGLGYLMSSWGESFMVPELFAGVVLISLIAVSLNEGIRAVELHYGKWRENEGK